LLNNKVTKETIMLSKLEKESNIKNEI